MQPKDLRCAALKYLATAACSRRACSSSSLYLLTAATGTKRTSQHALPMSAFGGKADIALKHPNVANDPKRTWSLWRNGPCAAYAVGTPQIRFQCIARAGITHRINDATPVDGAER
jgi:hypothetical protein